jgi:hypothetical protein
MPAQKGARLQAEKSVDTRNRTRPLDAI